MTRRGVPLGHANPGHPAQPLNLEGTDVMNTDQHLVVLPRCGAAFIGAPPEHGLCDQCLADLDTPRPASPGRQTSPARCAAARSAPTAAKPLLTLLPAPPDPALVLAKPAEEVTGDDG